jgi:ABC-2 type transport system ATP-binding protein
LPRSRASWRAPGPGLVAMTDPLAQCDRVTRAFGSFVAVDGVDLELRRGEVVGLLGANGAGKTTLIRLLLGLLAPTGGAVRLFGEAPSRRTRRRLGYVPQSLGLYDDLTPAENLAFSAAVFGSRGRGDHGGPKAVAGLPGPLRPYARTPVGSLPLGIQRGVAFAEALAHGPDLLILDEPTSGVDPLARARLWDTVASAASAGAGVLITTHYMDEAGECDRLAVMAAGRVVAAGTAREITGDAQVTVVDAESWAPAFEALEQAGLPVALVGRALRVPGATPAEVSRALGAIPARVRSAPATLEERFFQLTLTFSATEVPG